MSEQERGRTEQETQPTPSELRELAANLGEQVSRVAQRVHVTLMRLDGSTQEVRLFEAGQRAAVLPTELRSATQSMILDSKLREHDQQSLAKSGSEPETLREWIGAVARGKLAVAIAVMSGAVALRILQFALIAGIVGLSVHTSGTLDLIERAKSLELTLLARTNEAELARSAPPDVAATKSVDCESTPSNCADDSTTISQLRVVFRASAAQALQSDMAALAPRRPVSVRRQAFSLGAVDSRRAILAQAQRAAAPSLDRGAEVHRYESSSSLDGAAKPDVLDDAFKRRVDTLRAHEPTWRRARAWAARPVSPDYASEAFLRTALGDISGPEAHSLRVWSEQASTDFTRELMRTGDPLSGAHELAARRVDAAHYAGTARDHKLFREFSAEAPERVSRQLADFETGVRDPGSLRRASTSVAGRAAGRNIYGELFPSVAENPGIPGRAAPPVHAEAPRVRVAARSYARVRFSTRIGGVVFGRPPEEGGTPPEVTALSWRFRGDRQILLSVQMRDGSSVTLGPYHPAVVHHALAYVADGRVVVATLPQPRKEPGELFSVPARRVLVHPAFEDTAFACNVIQIDRFVDAFTHVGDGQRGSELLKKIDAARTGVTYLGAVLSDRKILDGGANVVVPPIQAHARACSDDSKCFPLKRYSGMGLDFGSATQFIDCLRHNADASTSGSCGSTLGYGPSRNSYSVDSGVRERPYKVDPQLRFVSGLGHEQDKLWPIEFMIQAVPMSADGSDAQLNGSDAQDPWQFPTIAEELQAAVAQGIANDAGAREIFRNVREFVALQRLFRTALDGELGDSLPLDALVRLSAATKSYIQVRRHERWNVNAPFQKFTFSVRHVVIEELQREQPNIEGGASCRQAVGKILAAKNKNTSANHFDFWRFMANLDSYCANEPAMKEVFALQKELRHQEVIGEVLALEHQKPVAGTRFSCGAL